MPNKVRYELRKNKNGKQYGVKIDLKTNKAKIVKLAYAKRRISDNKYQRKKAVRVKKEKVKTAKRVEREKEDLEFYGIPATHDEYVKAQKIVEMEYRADPDKAKWSESQIKSRSKINAMRYRTGYGIRVKYIWRWFIVIKVEKKGIITYKKDNTPKYTAWHHQENVDTNHLYDPEEYKDWEQMKKETDAQYDEIMNEVYFNEEGIPALEGGACLVFYNKLSKQVLHVKEWKPDGCAAHVTMKKA